MNGRILVAGVGNIFFRDDGFGCEAARRLLAAELPEPVRVVDFGIRGMHLAYELLEGYDALVVLDALPRGGSPGDIVVLEVGPDDLASGELDPHGMAPAAVLASLGSLGGHVPPTYVVGCEPADVSEGLGLSPAVAAAADRAVEVVMDLLRNELGLGGHTPASSTAALSTPHP